MLVNFFNGVARKCAKSSPASAAARSRSYRRPEFLRQRHVPDHPKANTLDLSRLLFDSCGTDDSQPRYCTRSRNDGLHERPLDDIILQDAKDAITDAVKMSLNYKIRNINRSVGRRSQARSATSTARTGCLKGRSR
jgi:glutamate synthase (NADPH/NADH) large chain/glutamate synthase (ferredoxin)